MVRPVAHDGDKAAAFGLVAPINAEINRLEPLVSWGESEKRVSDKKVNSIASDDVCVLLVLDSINELRISLSSQLIPRRRNIFHPIHPAPFATQIKPLDRKFKLRSHSEGPADVIFYGYLP